MRIIENCWIPLSDGCRLAARIWLPEVWLRHQRRDAYWQHGSVCGDLSQIRCPVYAIGGWADAYSNAIPRLLEGLTVPRKGLIGSWAHTFPQEGTPGPAIGFLQEALRWWDHWLRGIDRDLMDEPMYRAWMRESVPPQLWREERPGRWVAEPSWPSSRIIWKRLALEPAPLDNSQSETRFDVCSPQTTGLTSGDWCHFGAGSEMPTDQREDDGKSLIFDCGPLGERLEILGARTAIIGVIEGVAEATASLLKVFSGWFSDKQRTRKWLAVAGYAIFALSKPFFYVANSWGMIAAVRWADRVGKGVRTAPRDALVADSISKPQRGLAFGFERAADTAGAMCGVLIALAVVWRAQAHETILGTVTFRTVVLISLIPAVLAVLSLAIGVHDVPVLGQKTMPTLAFRSLGKPFVIFMIIVGIFDLGNSSDAFLVLRAQECGLSVTGILGMLAAFNLVYALVSTPAGQLSDRIGRRQTMIGGWLLYAVTYLGFGLAQAAWQMWALYVVYGVYYGLAYGTAKAMIADLVPEALRGTAYGTHSAMLGVLDFPASVIAGVLWQGVGSWAGFGAPVPFLFGGGMALLTALLMAVWKPCVAEVTRTFNSVGG